MGRPRYTRTTYKAVADILRSVRDSIYTDQQVAINFTVDEFVDLFENDNPNFDADKFRKACDLWA